VLQKTAAGTLSIQSTSYWFGANLINGPIDLSGRTQLTYDLISSSGTNVGLVLKLGPNWEWCETAAVNTGWTRDAHVGANAVKFDLTSLSSSCLANLNDAHVMYLSFDANSTNEIDNITVN